jgi:hypothetical protein
LFPILSLHLLSGQEFLLIFNTLNNEWLKKKTL